jgi:L-fuconolactonase
VSPQSRAGGTVIDTHQHFWRFDAAEYGWIDNTMAALQRNFLPADARREMDAAGVAGCIAVQARQTLEETRWLLHLAAGHPFIRGVVGWIDLQGDVDAQLAGFPPGSPLVGLRHTLQGEPDGFMEQPAFLAGLARLEPTGLGYDILVYARQLPAAVELVRRFPRQHFVLDHLGKPDVRGGEFHQWRSDIDRMAALPNVCCKLSGLVTEADWQRWTPGQLRPYLDAALDAFGPQRLMVGSDWPVCLVAAPYAATLGLVREAISEYSADEQQRMLAGTASEFWSL